MFQLSCGRLGDFKSNGPGYAGQQHGITSVVFLKSIRLSLVLCADDDAGWFGLIGQKPRIRCRAAVMWADKQTAGRKIRQ